MSVMALQGRKSSPQKSRPLESGHRRHAVWIAIEYRYKRGQKKEFKFWYELGWFLQRQSHMSQGTLNKKMKHFNMILNHFWRRWRKEYLLSLRDYHRYSKGIDIKKELSPGDVVVMYDDSHQRGFWRLARVQKLVKGVDGQVIGAVICVQSKGEKRATTLRRPVMHLYPLEINHEIEENVDGTTESISPVEPAATSENSRPVNNPQPQPRRPRREAAERAREWMQAVLND